VFARSLALAATTGLCLIASAAASLDAGPSLRFGFLPQKTFQGQPASLSVTVRPSGVRCSALLRYADGSVQRLTPVVARRNKAAWKWDVPAKVKLGSATATVTCARAGRVSRTFRVIGAPSAPAKVIVQKSGFSQRIRYNDRAVSYGVVLHNTSPENDALDVAVLINFIDSTNRVVATDTDQVDAVGAGSEFYLGGSTSIPDGTPVSSLEIVTRIGSQAPKHKLGPPTSDVLVQESRFDEGWVGGVVGQILNDHPTMMLSSPRVSTVVFDSAGNVIGGTQGGSTSGLLPGVRAYFSASQGADSIPFDRAASAGVSVLGQYEQTR
jgi:hypothetical protein